MIVMVNAASSQFVSLALLCAITQWDSIGGFEFRISIAPTGKAK